MRGHGGRGNLARYAHRPGEGSRIVACCDVNRAAFQRNRAWYGDDLYTTTDYTALLERDLDAVFVTTPDFLHEEHAIAALEAGLRACRALFYICNNDPFGCIQGK